MKYEKEATTKNGRRTWKVTYELVRGPEPRLKRKDRLAATVDPPNTAEKREPKEAPPLTSKPKEPPLKPARGKKKKAKGDGSQLGMF